jgi:RND superfamily putative drug exporter
LEVIGVFAAIGRLSYRYRWPVVVVWVIAFGTGLLLTTRLPSELKGGGFADPGSPAQVALELMNDKLHTGLSTVSVVFTEPAEGNATGVSSLSAGEGARGAAFQAAEARALARITPQSVPGLQTVQTYATTGDPTLVSKDGKAAAAVLVFDITLEEAQKQVPRVRSLLQSDGLKAYVTGEPAVYADLENLSSEDLRRAESYALPFALVVLLLIFGSVVAAALPVIGGGMAVTITLGVVYFLAQRTDMSIFVMNTASMLGLAVGIDYSLFIVGRFREELAGGSTVAHAVETTVARAGRSIFFSGIAVVIGLLGLVTFPYMSLRSMGWGGSIVVFFSVASALTLLPAILGILGPRVDSLRVLGRKGRQGHFWEHWSRGVMRHPWIVMAGTVAVILVFSGPVLHIDLNVPTATSLPTSQEARQGYDILQSRFDRGALSPISVMLTWRGGDQSPLSAQSLAALYEFGHELEKLPGVASVSSVVNQPGLTSPEKVIGFWQAVGAAQAAGPSQPGAPDGPGAPGQPQSPVTPEQVAAALELAKVTTAPGAVLFSVAPKADPTSAEAQDLAVAVRGLKPPVLPPAGAAQGGGLAQARAWVAGLSAGVHDFLNTLYTRFPWVVLYIFVVSYVVLLVVLRSVVLPLKAVLMNTLSILCAFGALVFVFQEGHFERVLDFTSTGSIDATLPIIMFCTVFGVSMDYEVFLLTRMREAWLETHDNQRAVAFGLTKTGRIITSAALIIVIVAGSFALTSILITKVIGVGLAVAIALDATVIRILLVPATMRILGRVNWWSPKWLDRVVPRIGEE